MNAWNKAQLKKLDRFGGWLKEQEASAKAQLGRCADCSPTIDVLEDRLIDIKRISAAIEAAKGDK